MLRFFLSTLLVFAFTSVAIAGDSVKVFILAGQSNMQGHGKVDAEPKANEGKGSLEWLVKNPETATKYRHLVDEGGQWAARSDVQIWYLTAKIDIITSLRYRGAISQ